MDSSDHVRSEGEGLSGLSDDSTVAPTSSECTGDSTPTELGTPLPSHHDSHETDFSRYRSKSEDSSPAGAAAWEGPQQHRGGGSSTFPEEDQGVTSAPAPGATPQKQYCCMVVVGGITVDSIRMDIRVRKIHRGGRRKHSGRGANDLEWLSGCGAMFTRSRSKTKSAPELVPRAGDQAAGAGVESGGGGTTSTSSRPRFGSVTSTGGYSLGDSDEPVSSPEDYSDEPLSSGAENGGGMDFSADF